MRDYQKLIAFRLAHDAVLTVYRITKLFPKEEIFGLIAQMRRAALSIPSNIVEGCSRSSEKDYQRLIEIAFGSCRELHYQTTLSQQLSYLSVDEYAHLEPKREEFEKVLGALYRSLHVPPKQPTT